MGQVLHGCATTTHAVRAAIQRSKAPIAELAQQHGLNRKTVRKWRGRDTVQDAPMGPKAPRSTVLTPAEEAMAVAFRRHTLLPLDDCLYALCRRRSRTWPARRSTGCSSDTTSLACQPSRPISPARRSSRCESAWKIDPHLGDIGVEK